MSVNSENDRETPNYTASEYASTILEMLRRYDKPRRPHVITSDQRASRLITHVVCLEGGSVRVDETAIRVGHMLVSPMNLAHLIRVWVSNLSKCLGWCMVRKMDNYRCSHPKRSSGPWMLYLAEIAPIPK